MTVDVTNPAKRLIQILNRAKSMETGNINGYVAWARVFNIPVPPKETEFGIVEEEVTSRLLELQKLVDEIEYKLRSIEVPNLELYLNPFPRLRYIARLGHLNNNNFASLIYQVSEGDMAVLEFCAAKLNELPSEPTLSEDQLNELLEDVNALYEQVSSSNLEHELKIFILNQLHDIRDSIHQYNIRGIKRLREALEKSVGAILVNEDLVRQSIDKEEVKQFGRIVNNLATYISIASNVSKIAETVIKFFPV